MCFGEFICSETGKYQSTIVNGNTDEKQLVLKAVEPGTIVHTYGPQVNTKAKNKNYTKYRALMRIIDEQPIYIQDLYKSCAHPVSIGKDVAVVVNEVEKETEQCQNHKAVEKTEKLPYRIGVAKTTLRYKYIDKLVADSPRNQSSKNVHAETVGDLVDYCIEHNINPYQNDA